MKIIPLHGRGGVKKLGGEPPGRAIAPANPCPMRLCGSLALPISAGFEVFHTFRVQGWIVPNRKETHPEGHAFCPPEKRIFTGVVHAARRHHRA